MDLMDFFGLGLRGFRGRASALSAFKGLHRGRGCLLDLRVT